eukprot:scaffold95570_cov18-Tisochrysis_lutea.AAC.1
MQALPQIDQSFQPGTAAEPGPQGVAIPAKEKIKKGKIACQVRPRAARKGSLTSKLARASPKRLKGIA